MFAIHLSTYRLCSYIIALTFLFGIVFNFIQPVRALEAIILSPEIQAIDLTKTAELYQVTGSNEIDRRLQLSSAPGADGIIRRFEVSASNENSSPSWLVFALTNDSDEPLDRLVVMAHFTQTGMFPFWKTPVVTRMVSILATKGFPPQRETATDSDLFRITLDARTTVTFVIELKNLGSPEIFLWKPEAFQNGAFSLHKSSIPKSPHDASVDSKAVTHGAKVTLKLVNSAGGEALAGTKFVIVTKEGHFVRELFGAFPSSTIQSGEYVIIAQRHGEIYQALFSVEPGADREFEVITQHGRQQSIKPDRWTQVARSNLNIPETKKIVLDVPKGTRLEDALRPHVTQDDINHIIAALGSSHQFDSVRVIKIELDDFNTKSGATSLARASISNSLDSSPQIVIARADDGAYVRINPVSILPATETIESGRGDRSVRTDGDNAVQNSFPDRVVETSRNSLSNSDAQTPLPLNVSGPFGFTWGSSPDKAPTKLVRKVDLNTKDLFDTSGYICARNTISPFYTSSESWKLTYDNLESNTDLRIAIISNSLGLDRSMNGEVEAHIHKINILGKEMEVCAAYLKNSLFQLSIFANQYDFDKNGLVESSLTTRYGEGNAFCGRGYCLRSWNDEQSRVHITRHTTDGLTYVFAPIKLDHIKRWTEFYKKTHNNRASGSKF
jgi:hypothetical protein